MIAIVFGIRNERFIRFPFMPYLPARKGVRRNLLVHRYHVEIRHARSTRAIFYYRVGFNATGFVSVCTILVGQLLGFFKSLDLGLHPDSPSLSGAISWVVNGVTIY